MKPCLARDLEEAIDWEPGTGTCDWLRFYQVDGSLVPLPAAAQQRTEQEPQRAE